MAVLNYIITYSYYEEYVNPFVLLIKDFCHEIGNYKLIIVLGKKYEEKIFKKFGSMGYESRLIFNADPNSWEFGGYQTGLDIIKKDFKQGDSLYILNDTVAIHSFFPRWNFKNFVRKTNLYAPLSLPTIVGEIGRHDGGSNLQVLGLDVNYWVRSCVFSLNFAGLQWLDWSLNDRIFNSSIHQKDSRSLDMIEVANDNLQLRINNWLLGVEPRKRWKSSSGTLDDGNLDFFKCKASSILKEKWLSARISSAGGGLVSMLPDGIIKNIIFRIHRRIWILFND